MTFAAELVEQVRTELLGNQTEEWSKLQGDITTTAETLVLGRETRTLKPGHTISVGLEDMHVWDFTPGAQPALVVQRGTRATIKTTHAAGDVVEVNPRFSRNTILRAINMDIRSLSSPVHGMFRVRTLPLESSGTALAYDLSGAGDLIEVLGVQVDTVGTANEWPWLHSWELRRNQSTDDFPSQLALRVDDVVPTGRNLHLTYKSRFGELASLADNVESKTGLPPTAVDIPVLGAQARLLGTSDARRTFLDSQPDTRRSQEVQPGSAGRAAAVLMQLRRNRIAEERARLQALYPPRKW